MQQKVIGRAAVATIVRFGAAFGYLVSVHFAALVGRIEFAVYGLTAFFLLNLLAAFLKSASRREVAFWAIGGATILFAVSALARVEPGAAVLIYLTPILVYVFLFFVFAATLMPGREPLITRVYRADQGEVDPLVVPYTRQLTMVWAGLFALLAILSTTLLFYVDIGTWSWISNVVGPALSMALFVGEHAIRPARYGRTSPVRTFRTMLRPGSWAPH